jgi:electron transport complex protein RnfD
LKIDPRPAPHIHYHENTRVIQADVLLPMLVVYAMSYYYYGLRALLLGVTGVLSAVLADILCLLIQGKRPNYRDLSAMITGMIIPLLLPASIPYPVVMVAAFFGILVAKHPFGGMGYNVFNPAAAGLAFVIVCFPTQVFSYPIPRENLPLFSGEGLLLTNSPAFTLLLDGTPAYDWVEMALGNFPGPMGATNILVILACLLYLVLRGAVRWQTPLAFLLTFCALCWLFPRPSMEPLATVLYEVMSGTVLFGGVFMLTDPVTSPQRGWSSVFYGMTAAVLMLAFRRYSRLEEEFVFVLLLVNGTVWGFDIIGEKIAGWIRRRTLETDTNPKIPKKS